MSGYRDPWVRQMAMIAMALKLRALAGDLEALAIGDLPDPAVLDDAPVLDCWSLAERREPCLIGIQSGHPVLTGNSVITTSGLYFLDREAGVARTLSRWYRLGRQQDFVGFLL